MTSELPSPMPTVELETPTRRGDVVAAVLCLLVGLAGYYLIVPAAVYVPSKVAGTANSPAFLPNVLFLLLINQLKGVPVTWIGCWLVARH